MLFLIAALVILVITPFITIWLFTEYEESPITFLFPPISALIIMILIAFCTHPKYFVEKILDDYEKGKIVKEYRIIESDTTYRWVYKKS